MFEGNSLRLIVYLALIVIVLAIGALAWFGGNNKDD